MIKKFFLDTNIIIDFLTDRKPFSLNAAKLFNFSESKKIEIYISAISYNNIYYILKQSLSDLETRKLLDAINDMTEVVDLTKSIIRKSLKSDFKDFEDAIQYYSAMSIENIDAIVTRNAKDFKKSSLSLMTSHEAVRLLENL